MTMNSIYSKLRKHNIKNYYLLIFCIVLSVVLVTSYAIMFFSPTVQNVFPEGGDSRKQAYFIFSVAIIGCALFTTYAASLFFRYRSYETGVLLSLGASKSSIRKALLIDIIIIIAISFLGGLLLSLPISFLIWKLFQIIVVNTQEMNYTVGWDGFLFGILFCIFITLCIATMTHRFIKRSDIMSILKEHKKSEPVKLIKKWYGITGILMLVLGLFLAVVVPHISYTYFNYAIPGFWNVTYVFALVGIYMTISYIIMYNKKGENPERYYRNIIPISMMKFEGRQTIQNMCVITVLIVGALFAAFYCPAIIVPTSYSLSQNPIDYKFTFRENEEAITKKEVYEIADKYDVKITSYDGIESLLLIVNGYEEVRSNNDYTGKVTYNYMEKSNYNNFVRLSEFNRLTNQNISLNSGEYMTILSNEHSEMISDAQYLDLLTNPTNNQSQKMVYTGAAIYEPLKIYFYTYFTHILSDADYDNYKEGLSSDNIEYTTLFNVEGVESTYDFAKALKDLYLNRSSGYKTLGLFCNEYEIKEEININQKTLEDFKDQFVEMNTEDFSLVRDWKYFPEFRILSEYDLINNYSVFIMMFVYITIICYAAVGVIAYTRSITIAINNQMLFADLRKLGANDKYITKTVRTQLKKIFIIPTLLGSFAMVFLFTFILYSNSGSITYSEALTLLVNIVIMLISWGYMGAIYAFAFGKIKKMINISK